MADICSAKVTFEYSTLGSVDLCTAGAVHHRYGTTLGTCLFVSRKFGIMVSEKRRSEVWHRKFGTQKCITELASHETDAYDCSVWHVDIATHLAATVSAYLRSYTPFTFKNVFRGSVNFRSSRTSLMLRKDEYPGTE